MEYRNLTTGETVPAHRIGTTEDGRELYQFVEGHKPAFAYESDEDGNWVRITTVRIPGSCGCDRPLRETECTCPDCGELVDGCCSECSSCGCGAEPIPWTGFPENMR